MNNVLDIMEVRNQMVAEKTKQTLLAYNELSMQYGLCLSEEDVRELIECRNVAVKEVGRVEFGEGILPKLIYAFCDSPYINSDSYKDILAELQEAFYYFKNETMETYTDDELIEYMVKVFNGSAEGSVEYLVETSLERLARAIKKRNLLSECEEDDDGGELF